MAQCVQCGFDLPAQARFCPSCGAPVRPVEATEERKLATVLFADLVGSTELGTSVEFDEPTRIDAKGKHDGVVCRRLIRALTLTRPRGVGGLRRTLVGRDRELELLEATYRRVVSDRDPHVVTIMGEAGVGKSRLVRELWGTASAATPPGRCGERAAASPTGRRSPTGRSARSSRSTSASSRATRRQKSGRSSGRVRSSGSRSGSRSRGRCTRWPRGRSCTTPGSPSSPSSWPSVRWSC